MDVSFANPPSINLLPQANGQPDMPPCSNTAWVRLFHSMLQLREVSWQGQHSILHVKEMAYLRTISWSLLVFCGWVGLRCSIFILAAEAHLLLDGPIREPFQDSWQYRDSQLRHKFLARILRTMVAHGISKLAP